MFRGDIWARAIDLGFIDISLVFEVFRVRKIRKACLFRRGEWKRILKSGLMEIEGGENFEERIRDNAIGLE